MMLVLWDFLINGVQGTSQIIAMRFDWKSYSVCCFLGLQEEKEGWKNVLHSQNALNGMNHDKQERKGRLQWSFRKGSDQVTCIGVREGKTLKMYSSSSEGAASDHEWWCWWEGGILSKQDWGRWTHSMEEQVLRSPVHYAWTKAMKNSSQQRIDNDIFQRYHWCNWG